MYVYGVPSVWTKIDLGEVPTTSTLENRPEGSLPRRHDLRFVRQQVVTLRQALRDLQGFASSHEDGELVDDFHQPSRIVRTFPQAVPATDNDDFPQPQLPRSQARLPSPPATAQIASSLADIRDALVALQDNDRLIGKPGPLLEVLREQIRTTITSVFNERGPGFVPPFPFGFYFPSESHAPKVASSPTPSQAVPLPADPDLATASSVDAHLCLDTEGQQLLEFLFGSNQDNTTGIVEPLTAALEEADEQLSRLIGDTGIFVDELV